MSFLDSLFNAPTTPADNKQEQQPQQQQQVDKKLSDNPPSTDANGNLPSGTPVNPLDALHKMYQNANKDSIQAPEFRIDPKALGEVSKSMDFTKAVDPSLLEKALQGDTKALLATIQAVGQSAYSASLEHATALTDTHLKQRLDYENKRTAQTVRSQLTDQELGNTPNYSHPLVKEELNRIAQRIAQANPDAPPKQIAQAAAEQLRLLSAAITPAQQSQQSKTEDVDWAEYLK